MTELMSINDTTIRYIWAPRKKISSKCGIFPKAKGNSKYQTTGGMSLVALCMISSSNKWSSHCILVRLLIFCNTGIKKWRNILANKREMSKMTITHTILLVHSTPASLNSNLRRNCSISYSNLFIFYREKKFIEFVFIRTKRQRTAYSTIDRITVMTAAAFSSADSTVSASA